MTNTHINVGGHKITTNRVKRGQATLNTTDFGGTGSVYYKVVNGMCTVLIAQIIGNSSAVGQDKVLATGLPKCGLYTSYPIWDGSIQNMGYAYIQEGTTYFVCHPHNTNMFWCSFVYPVADDWVES